jgi:Zn-dependent M16 (insulinase) family peptidase
MTQISDPNNAGLNVGDEICGYRIQRITALQEIGAVFYRLEHTVTGARHVHISNQDQENTFGVTFKTVPTDSTGVAHILEHTVLCGSRNFPVRDPFFSMLKRSLSTFMNAFTASDWTMYPFSTQNRKDFYNLMDVYLDAAFSPNLDRLSFKQEGHRLEIEGEGDGGPHLVYKGVVYNEMKGAMSSPDQVMGRSLLNALYPDTTYSNNSGGDPAVIPQLTHEQLIAFHQRHYHPSNAYFYTYGNLPLKDHLSFIADKIMCHYRRIDPKTDVPPQARWNAPRTARYTYPLSSGEDPSRKSQVSLAWLTSDIRDTFDVLVLTVLEQILLGNAASPLRKALMDSGLGSALSDGTGYEADNRDTVFACGLKDAAEDSADAIERIILDTLGDSVRKGLDPESIASAIHQIEFHRKEVTNTPYPYGLKLLLMIIGSWLHGGDPERILQLDADFAQLREAIAAGPFLENQIKRYFLDNPHRVRLCLAPDLQQAQAEEARVRAELDDQWGRLDDARRRQIEAEAVQLKQRQESAEEISCLPTLALADIPPQVVIYAPTDIATDPPLWRYAQPTSGIYYLSAAVGAAGLPEALRPWVPFFCYALAKIGTRRFDYAQMARRIDAATGGVGLSVQARVLYDHSHQCMPLMQFNAKCLARNIDPMVAIVEELIAEADFNDLNRLKQLLGEYRSGLDTMIVQNGHRLAISSSSRTFSTAGALAEMWSGIQQVRMIRNFSSALDDKGLRETADRLAAIAKAVFGPDNVILSAIGEAEAVETATRRTHASQVMSAFRRDPGDVRFQTLELQLDAARPQEGWSTSTSVAFVARTLPTINLGHPDAAGMSVQAKLLRSLYLHREIREKGGAYGGFAVYNPEYGLFSLASYRDPHIVRTLKVYEGALDFLKTAPIGEEDIKEAVLQVCSEIDKPDPPGPAAHKAFLREIVGLTDDVRLAYKQQLLAITRAEVMRVAETYLADLQQRSAAAVIAGQTQLEAANAQLGGQALALQAI